MLNTTTVLIIVLMAVSTYLTRVLGYLLLRKRTLSPRLQAVLDNVPGCVLLAVIAPAFVAAQPAKLLALGITLLAACRLPLLPTVAIGIAASGVLGHLLGA
ncbi:AzlD family protein [Vogesella facilis]|uniref:AzlD family protein n=1 Tax=Vogesella facilis TaxID=1655232 RepID=A0ABV7RGX3_9NEIS